MKHVVQETYSFVELKYKKQFNWSGIIYNLEYMKDGKENNMN